MTRAAMPGRRPIAGGITKDTTLCLSLSGRPSNIGTRFHNYLYDELGLDFVYKAFTTTDIRAAVAGIRGLGIRGAAISMPWKEDVLELVDEVDPSAAAIESVNTIVNTDGRLVAYNTDYLALVGLLATHQVDAEGPAAVLGAGGMAKAAVAALRASEFADITVIARNTTSGPALASKYAAGWLAEPDDRLWGLILNATPIGMAGGADSDRLPVPDDLVQDAHTVFDVVAVPSETPLIRRARRLDKQVITGSEVIALQAAEQFRLYTGVRPSEDQVRRAAEFSREE